MTLELIGKLHWLSRVPQKILLKCTIVKSRYTSMHKMAKYHWLGNNADSAFADSVTSLLFTFAHFCLFPRVAPAPPEEARPNCQKLTSHRPRYHKKTRFPQGTVVGNNCRNFDSMEWENYAISYNFFSKFLPFQKYVNVLKVRAAVRGATPLFA